MAVDPDDAKLGAMARAAAAARRAEMDKKNAAAAAAASESRAALARLTSGATLTNAERAVLNMGPAPVAQTDSSATVSQNQNTETPTAFPAAGTFLGWDYQSNTQTTGTLRRKILADGKGGQRIDLRTEKNPDYVPGSRGGGGGGDGGGTDALAELLRQQKAAADAAAAAAAKAKEAERMASKIKASDRLTNLFKGYGIEGLATFINQRIMEDASEESVLIELYERPEYKLRFPGMESLRKKNRTISEKEYIDIENAFVQTARFFDIPKGFYDSADDFGNLIANEVSAKEFQDRLQIGQDVGKSLDPNVRSALKDFYGIGEGGITAYVLNADKALPILQKQAKAATIAGLAKSAGFNTIYEMGKSEELAGMDAYAKLSEQQLKQGFGTAQAQRGVQQRLARIEGTAYNEQEALQATIEGSAMAQLESKKRAEREAVFRFGGRSGVGGTSLRSTTNQ